MLIVVTSSSARPSLTNFGSNSSILPINLALKSIPILDGYNTADDSLYHLNVSSVTIRRTGFEKCRYQQHDCLAHSADLNRKSPFVFAFKSEGFLSISTQYEFI